MVLLTDGQNTVGPDPMDAAQMAANRGVKTFTVTAVFAYLAGLLMPAAATLSFWRFGRVA